MRRRTETTTVFEKVHRTPPLEGGDNDLLNLQWWVDASYAVHDNMKSYTGGTFSMGKGSIYSMSSGQN